MMNLPGFASQLATSPDKRNQYMNNGGQDKLAGMLGQRVQPNQQAFQNANQNAQFKRDQLEATTPWQSQQRVTPFNNQSAASNTDYLNAAQLQPMDRGEYMQESMARNEDPGTMNWQQRRAERLRRRMERVRRQRMQRRDRY
jgi:hypothetical protein